MPTSITHPRVFTFWTGPMPPIIKLCLDTIVRNNPGAEVWTLDKWRDVYDGRFGPWANIVCRKPNVQSDILRYWLLGTYGGIWLDADYISFRDIRGVWDQSADYIGYLERPPRPMPYTAMMGGHPDSPVTQKQCELANAILKQWKIGRRAGPVLTLEAIRACPDAAITYVQREMLHPLLWRHTLWTSLLRNATTPFEFIPDSYGLMLLGRVIARYRPFSRQQLIDDHTVIGQAFRKATNEQPSYWMTTDATDRTPKSGVAEWILTYECNLACTSCARLGYSPPNAPPMTLDDAQAFVKQCREIGWTPRKILITGGEPTLHPDIREFCRIASELCPGGVEVWSNGYTDRSREILDEIRADGYATSYDATWKRKGSIVQPITDMLTAPSDFGETWREPCKWHTSKAIHCGISVDHNGYTACPNGGVYCEALGIDIKTKTLADLFDPEFAERQTNALCKYCGMLYSGLASDRRSKCKIVHGTPMSPLWQTAMERIKNEKEPDNGN